MPDIIYDLLAIVGGVTLFFIAVFLVIALCDAIKEGISQLKRKYQYKHRFDKPPTAKCYCVDCIHRNDETNQCYRFGVTTKEYRCTADNWFCWEAEPHKK